MSPLSANSFVKLALAEGGPASFLHITDSGRSYPPSRRGCRIMCGSIAHARAVPVPVLGKTAHSDSSGKTPPMAA
jgi:hypothetical protein